MVSGKLSTFAAENVTKMDKKKINDTLRRNVALLSKQTEKEVGMMPATEAPLPSVQTVKEIVTLTTDVTIIARQQPADEVEEEVEQPEEQGGE